MPLQHAVDQGVVPDSRAKEKPSSSSLGCSIFIPPFAGFYFYYITFVKEKLDFSPVFCYNKTGFNLTKERVFA